MPPSSRPLRIAIMNDYEIIVSGVATMLAPFHDRIEVVELDNQALVASDVDIVLFDMFAHVSGLGVSLADVVSQGGSKVVVFTWGGDPVTVEGALAEGAAGYLSKTLAPLDLVKALEDIHAGAVVTTDTYEVMLGEGSGDSPVHVFDLSPREAEVLALIAKGLSNKEIAQTVFLSINSIKTYVRTAYAKIGVRTRSQAVVWAHQHGFAPQAGRTIITGDARERR